jgi:hypothetical protein
MTSGVLLELAKDEICSSLAIGSLSRALLSVWVVFDSAGFLIARVVLGEIPCDFGVLRIERVVQILCIAESYHGHAVGVVDIPARIAVLAIERSG